MRNRVGELLTLTKEARRQSISMKRKLKKLSEPRRAGGTQDPESIERKP